MAKMTITNGKGRVVTPAPKSANGKSAPKKNGATAKESGVRSRKKSLALAVTKANAINASRRVRQYCEDDGLIAFLDALTVRIPAKVWSEALTMGDKAKAQFLREWCSVHGVAGFVRAYDDGFSTRRNTERPEKTDYWRPKHAVQERLDRLPAPYNTAFFSVTADTAPKQLETVQALDWSDGLPESFAGGDGVFIFRLP